LAYRLIPANSQKRSILVNLDYSAPGVLIPVLLEKLFFNVREQAI
jgi:uncharacterized membrane protein